MEQKHTPRHFLKTNGLIRNDDTETINANVLAVIHSMEGYVQSKNSELLQQVAELTKENERKDEECRKAVHIMNEHRHNDLIEKDKEIKALTEQVEKLKAEVKQTEDLWEDQCNKHQQDVSRLREERKELMKTFRRLLEHCTKTNNFNQFDGILGEIRYVLSKFPEVPNE